MLSKSIPDICSSGYPTSIYDAYSYLYEAHYELKCRKTHYQSQIIEKYKWDGLWYLSNPFYIVHTSKIILAFNLLKIAQPKWVIENLPATTEFDSRHDKPKIVGYLPNELGIDITEHCYN